jgi:hypothetical protein
VKRSRGRGRRPQNNSGGGGGGGGHNHNRSFDSAGPDIKIRGTAANVYEKYLQLARDANSSGDRVQAENYLQHAEHYYRIMMAAQAHQAANMQNGQQGQNGAGQNGNVAQNGEQPAYGQSQPASSPSFSMADEGEDDAEGDEAA